MKPISQFALPCFVVLSALFYSAQLMAQESVASVPTGLTSHKVMVEEVMHSFTVTPYTPELSIEDPGLRAATPQTVERVVSAWIKAMQDKNFDAALSFWDDVSRRQIEERNRQQGKTPADWVRDWTRLYSGNRAVLTNRIKYGPYWMISYLVKKPSGEVVLGETVTLENVAGRWRLTLALADNVVHANWDSDKERIQRLASPLFKRVK